MQKKIIYDDSFLAFPCIVKQNKAFADVADVYVD